MQLNRSRFALWIALSSSSVVGCVERPTHPTVAAAPLPTPGRADRLKGPSVDIAKARAAHLTQAFTWMTWEPATFERAKAEHKLILVDGAAAWCHWCHVMDETTYADPEVGSILKDRFITIRVDIDERPDLAERYGEWGWPATIVLSPEAEELGKFRGYIPKDELLPILRGVTQSSAHVAAMPAEPAAPIDALPWIATRVSRDLDSYYDEAQGGWGMRQKAPLGANIELALLRASAGDETARDQAMKSLVAQRVLIDRVWGGMYQYSAGSSWNEPHFEKLMTVQASNLEASSKAYSLTHDEAYLRDAREIERFMETLLSSDDGGFFVTQDADLNAHDPKASFVEGKIFYSKTDADRRALGMPRIDDHIYAYENGRAIAALVTLYEATKDPKVLARARRAADLILRTHVGPEGDVKHDPTGTREVRYLSDAASFGRALVRLADVTKETTYRDAAIRIASSLAKSFKADGGALYGQTVDAHAVGVFSRRLRPFEANVIAARFLAGLATLTGDVSYRDQGRAIVAGLATPTELDGQGRMTGEFLLALQELSSGRSH